MKVYLFMIFISVVLGTLFSQGYLSEAFISITMPLIVLLGLFLTFRGGGQKRGGVQRSDSISLDKSQNGYSLLLAEFAGFIFVLFSYLALLSLKGMLDATTVAILLPSLTLFLLIFCAARRKELLTDRGMVYSGIVFLIALLTSSFVLNYLSIFFYWGEFQVLVDSYAIFIAKVFSLFLNIILSIAITIPAVFGMEMLIRRTGEEPRQSFAQIMSGSLFSTLATLAGLMWLLPVVIAYFGCPGYAQPAGEHFVATDTLRVLIAWSTVPLSLTGMVAALHNTSVRPRTVIFTILGILTISTLSLRALYVCNPAFCHTNIGKVYSLSGNCTRALREFERAIKIEPQYADAFAHKGFTYAGMGNFAAACGDYKKAVQLNPDDLFSLNRFCQLNRKLERPQEVIDLCDYILEHNASKAIAHMWKMYAYLDLEKNKEARNELDKLMHIAPDQEETYMARSYFLKKQGHLEAAIQSINEAIAINGREAMYHQFRSSLNYDVGNFKKAAEDSARANQLRR